MSGSSIIAMTPSITSQRLWGGISVAMPTAIPDEPFTRRFGNLEGSTSGSISCSSKFGLKSTVFFLMSATISVEIFDILASV